MVIIQQNGSLLQDVVAQGGLAVWHPLSQISPDGVNSIDDNPQDGLIDVEDIKQGASSGLDADLIDGRQVAAGTVWTSGNDGAGSGSDADLLDGLQANDILALSGGGLSFPVVRVIGTSQTYYGALGGRKGANERCAQEFGEGAVMYSQPFFDISNLAYPYCVTDHTCLVDWRIREGQFLWIDKTDSTFMSYTDNCNSWRTASTSAWGAVIDGMTHEIRAGNTDCSQYRPIVCIVPI